jgi:hypothetical protein
MSYLYTAVIIEPRKHPAMQFVLKNFLENLDERWGFMIFHGIENEQWLKEMIYSEFSSDKDRIQLNNLNISNLSWKEYNKLCSSSEIYKEISTEHFLIFQVDTIICSSEKNLIYEFMEYDYVGAPWLIHPGSDSEFCGKVGNGGLSLRKKSKILEIIENVPYPDGLSEDEYFCIYNKVIPLNRPTYEDAQLFSMETVYSPRCFGLHKPWLHEPGKIDLENQFPGYNELVRLNSLPVPIQATLPTLPPWQPVAALVACPSALPIAVSTTIQISEPPALTQIH